jgi:hypothetical protein
MKSNPDITIDEMVKNLYQDPVHHLIMLLPRNIYLCDMLCIHNLGYS